MRNMLGIASLAAVLLLAVFVPLFSTDTTDDFKTFQAGPKTIEIMILSRGFTVGNPHYVPENVTAKIGTQIVWVNGDLVKHTATSDTVKGKLDGEMFDSGPIPPKLEFVLDTSRMFDGVYPYHCAIHPWARGILTLITNPISVTTDRKLYEVGEQITVSGIASMPTEPETSQTLPQELEAAALAKSVLLEVLGPSEKAVLSKEVPILEGGRYTSSFTLAEAGEYSVRASFMDFAASTKFSVAELPTQRITVTGLKLEDKAGSSITVGKVGEPVFVKSTVRNMLQIGHDLAYIVQVKDSESVTVFLEWRTVPIAPMQILTSGIAWIPETAGTYVVEVFVWKSMDSPLPLTAKVEHITLIVS